MNSFYYAIRTYGATKIYDTISKMIIYGID